MKKFLIIILFLLLGLFWLKILYIVPYSNYTITDQTGKVKLKDFPELKEISFNLRHRFNVKLIYVLILNKI